MATALDAIPNDYLVTLGMNQLNQTSKFRYLVNKESGLSLEFDTAEDVFFPTHTSELLIKGARESIRTPGKLLDLGCGIGLCGLVLARLGHCEPPVYLSDMSARATLLSKLNAQKLGVPAVVRQGSLFNPWVDERFDIIVDDVSGISEDVARVSPWFPEGVECQTGKDGTALTVSVLQRAPRHLNRGGMLIFPVLSLSREERILDEAHIYFSQVSLVGEQVWFIPEEMLRHFDIIKPLLDQGLIRLEQKFGSWLWTTKIYKAMSPRDLAGSH